jgi:hypothetical protein
MPRGPHIGQYCVGCDRWIAWVPKRDAEPVMAEAAHMIAKVHTEAETTQQAVLDL